MSARLFPHRTQFYAPICSLLFITSLAAYWPIINTTLLSCDDYYLLGFDRIHLFGPGNLGSLTVIQWIFQALHPLFLRPFVISVWLVLSHFFATTPWPYHLLNIFLHAMNASLIFWLIVRMKGKKTTAALAAFLFVLTPAATGAVTWASASFDLFSCFFILLSICLYTIFLENENKRFYLGSLAAAAFALLSKEMAYIVIIVIPVMELLFGRVRPAALKDRGPFKRMALRSAPFLGLFLAYLVLRYVSLGTVLTGGEIYFTELDSNPLDSITVFLAPFDNNYFSFGIIVAAYIYMTGLVTVGLALVERNWSKAPSIRKRLLIFFFSMFIISLVPVGSRLIVGIKIQDLGLVRFLYMATAFFLATIAIALLEFRPKTKIWLLISATALAALLPFYFWGLQINNHGWEHASQIDGFILSEIQKNVPDPPRGAKVYILMQGGPAVTEVSWCRPMLEPAVRVSFDRYDLQVIQSSTNAYTGRMSQTDDGYLFLYDDKSMRLVLQHNPRV